eukprot:CAMPEP_0172495658 /NCGR_PEP_ID=MMETSP1066-20121228/74128_1 /TAXON_ID=671091 /ORGANISM="Coscinodiscus wailesii, Strain CCMP2513" /LENGTH=269 /DNA_ID=CAMNT_0013267475 /DNA_START=41 /DNA_END=850 /DNA_ORIENTATION=-
MTTANIRLPIEDKNKDMKKNKNSETFFDKNQTESPEKHLSLSTQTKEAPFTLDSHIPTSKKKIEGISDANYDMNEFNVIEKFISDSQKKPIFISWTNLTGISDEEVIELTVRALALTNQRGIIISGPSILSMETLRKATYNRGLIEYAIANILFVNEIPRHLFHRVGCIIENGEVDVTNEALRLDIPIIIVPTHRDQIYRARLVNQMGAGKGFTKRRLHEITAEEIGRAIVDVIPKKKNISSMKYCARTPVAVRNDKDLVRFGMINPQA